LLHDSPKLTKNKREEDEHGVFNALLRSHQLTLTNNGGFELKRVESEGEE